MADENAIAALENVLNEMRSNHNMAVAKLRETEAEADRLRQEISALENNATQLAKVIDGERLRARSGGRSMTLGTPVIVDEDHGPFGVRPDRLDDRSNIRDMPSRDFRRDSSIAYIDQSRHKLAIHDNF